MLLLSFSVGNSYCELVHTYLPLKISYGHVNYLTQSLVSAVWGYTRNMESINSELPLLVSNVLRKARSKHIPRDQIIFYEDDLPQDVYVLKSGIVKLYDIDEQGNEKILHIVKPASTLPFSYFSGMQDPLRWFYATVTDCEFLMMSYDEFHKAMQSNNEVATMLIREFSNDVHELMVRLSSLGKSSAQDKVFSAIKFLLVRHTTKRRGSWWRVTFPITHQLIADLCGITRESASISLKELQDRHIIRSPKVGVLEINKEYLLI